MNLKDERLHGVGIGQIEAINIPKPKDETIRVTVTFRGMKVQLDVPRSIVYPSGGSSPFADRMMVYVDFELVGTATTRTWGGSTFGVNSIDVGRVVEFRPLTKEEKG